MKIKISINWLRNVIVVIFLCCVTSVYAQINTPVGEERIIPEKWQSHPRLLFLKGEEKRVKKQIKKIPLVNAMYDRLLNEADSLLNVPVQQYALRHGYINDILLISREQVYRTVTLAMAYRMTHDKRYLQKCEQELINVCNFPDWNPRHYLDVAEMTTAVAIGYDWLYADLAPSTRKIIVEAIKTKALDLAVKEYEIGKSGSWAKRETNWNMVCNTGMVMGALAIAEDYPKVANDIVKNAIHFIPNYLKHFAPDGVCFEGPAYWGYTNTYLSLLLSALNTNFGQDFGLSDLEGIKKTVRYYMDTTSPAGKIFNFANSGATQPEPNPVYFYFSKNFKQTDAAVFYRNLLSDQLQKRQAAKGYFFLGIPWFDQSLDTENKQEHVLQVYKGINDIAVFRANGKNPNSIYLIAKGGDPDEAHQQMDVGTFIVESGGVRWSDDLGSDSYDLPGFWDGKPNGKRWSYFRNSNFSHNTIAIDNQIQYAKGIGSIVSYDAQGEQPYFSIDMSTVYQGQAKAVKRTFTHLSDTKIRITDDVDLLNIDQEVRWSMITAANIDCQDQIAILSKDGKRLRITIKGPQNVRFEIQQVPGTKGLEYPIKGYQLLQATAKSTKKVKFEIEMESLHDD